MENLFQVLNDVTKVFEKYIVETFSGFFQDDYIVNHIVNVNICKDIY